MTTLFDEPICAPRSATFADSFYTPPMAVKPLVPYLHPVWTIWEPCTGGRNLQIALGDFGLYVKGTDIIEPYGRDFLTWEMDYYDAIVTNPPYSNMDDFIARCYELGKPFALLLPIAALGGKRRQSMYRRHGIEIIMLGGRINFQTPTGKTHGAGSSATFETAWFTHGLNIGSALTFANIFS